MADNSHIEWTEATWNPLLGCMKVSAGCQHCYAINQVHRMTGNPNPKIRGATEGLTRSLPDGSLNWTGKVRTLPERLDQPLRWSRPRRIFVNSLSDLFHEDVPDVFINQVFAIMRLCPQHTFQVLTKRPKRAFEWATREGVQDRVALWATVKARRFVSTLPWPLPNVWLGTSVEDQPAADERTPWLLRTPAAVRWLSCEPLLGPVNLTRLHHEGLVNVDALHGRHGVLRPLGGANERIDWVVAGGESGPKARPMHPDWVRDIRDQCQVAGVAFFFKQWGEWIPTGERDSWSAAKHRIPGKPERWVHYTPNATSQTPIIVPRAHPDSDGRAHYHQQPMQRVGKKAAGRVLDGVTHDGYPAGAAAI